MTTTKFASADLNFINHLFPVVKMSKRIKRTIGRYKIRKRIKQTGIAYLYEARQLIGDEATDKLLDSGLRIIDQDSLVRFTSRYYDEHYY